MASQANLNKRPPEDEIAVGEKVEVSGCEGEFVVVNVDHDRGRVELLRLKPGKIEVGIPISSVSKSKSHPGPHLVRPTDK